MIEALLCLSLNAYHEARGEPIQAQIAVSQVALRRAGFDPRRVCKEIRRPAQFSWVGRVGKPKNRAAWRRAQYAARVALLWNSARHVPDYSAGADHYHAVTVAPRWAKSMLRVTTIGDHHFYRETARRPLPAPVASLR